jgi:Nucleotidyl transferase AbiEii toxin, Type IV TA system
MQAFKPHLEVLPAAQRKLWAELSAVPGEFVLYGGTALALHLGHRDSVDFDFFSNRAINLAALEAKIPFLKDARIIQREANTLSALIEREGRVQVSFFGVPSLPRLMLPHIANDNGLRIASLIDLAGTKASVLQLRAEAKDYIDMDALLRFGKVDLPTALAAAQKIYGPSFNPETTLKALSYFDDGNLRELPEELQLRLVDAARDVDLEHLPQIDHFTQRRELDHGYEL